MACILTTVEYSCAINNNGEVIVGLLLLLQMLNLTLIFTTMTLKILIYLNSN